METVNVLMDLLHSITKLASNSTEQHEYNNFLNNNPRREQRPSDCGDCQQVTAWKKKLTPGSCFLLFDNRSLMEEFRPPIVKRLYGKREDWRGNKKSSFFKSSPLSGGCCDVFFIHNQIQMSETNPYLFDVIHLWLIQFLYL